MTTDELRNAIFESLRHIAPEVDPKTLDPDLDLRDQLDIDSMDNLNFVLGLNAATGVDIPERDYPKLYSINEAVSYLAAHAPAAVA
jgi:acyl carrier protein